MGPRLWNTIPSHLHSVADPLQFKIKLTEFLKTIPDEPHVSGYNSAKWKLFAGLEYEQSNCNAARAVGLSDDPVEESTNLS